MKKQQKRKRNEKHVMYEEVFSLRLFCTYVCCWLNEKEKKLFEEFIDKTRFSMRTMKKCVFSKIW